MGRAARYRDEPESAKQCCLCSDPAIRAERRPTRDDGRMQSWPLCSKCWQQLQAERRNVDPEICRRYKIFIQYVVLGYPI